MATLAPAYLPRRPTESVLYGLVREHLASFLAFTREHYEGGLPSYVERELRAYLKCGVFAEGFTRVHCDACGHDLLVAFSCHGRSVCPSCCGRRMANTAAHLVDRVLPDVPIRQYVLSLPYELRQLAAFKADVLTAVARIFVEAVFAVYRQRARRAGLEEAQCGAVTFVQRFGSLNLNVHFHVMVLDGVFVRAPSGRPVFHASRPPTPADLQAVVVRAQRRCATWLRRRGYLDDRPAEERSNEPPAQTAIEGCAAIAMGRGQVATLARRDDDASDRDDDEQAPVGKPMAAVEHDGFNLHAGVRVEAGDDLGRERLMRYGARPPLSIERLRRLPGGRVAYRLKYVGRGRGKHRVMTAMEFMARLAAIICPPRYPLVRYSGVLGPRSSWRREIVPKPRPTNQICEGQAAGEPAKDSPPRAGTSTPGQKPRPPGPSLSVVAPPAARPAIPGAMPPATPGPLPILPRGAVTLLAPNIVSVPHWDRLLGGLLYAATPRVDWATLLRRSFAVDVLECPRCHGRLRVLAVITEREPIERILTHLSLPASAPPLARARAPTSPDVDDDLAAEQLSLDLA